MGARAPGRVAQRVFDFSDYTMNTTSRLLLLASVAATPVFFTGCETTQGVRNPAGVPVTEMRPDEKA